MGGLGNARRKLLRRSKLSMPVALGGLLLTAGIAIAVGGGLQNPSFENGLDHWTASTIDARHNRDVVYGPGGSKGPVVPGCDAPDAYNICVVDGDDTFPVTDDAGTRNVTVSPIDGAKMLRLAGPFENDDSFTDPHQAQPPGHVFKVEQQFTVDPDNPVFAMNYNLFTFDYSGFDELKIKVSVEDGDGDLVARTVQGGFGPSGNTNLKTTGWRSAPVDLSAYAGDQMFVRLAVVGTSDQLFGSWGYFDAGDVPLPPVDPNGAEATTSPGITVNKQVDPGSGQVFFNLYNPQLIAAGGCVPMTFSLPVNAGSSTLSNMTLSFNGQNSSMTNTSGNTWQNATPITVCDHQPGDLHLDYDATENGDTQHFSIVIGAITLIDPSGIVTNAVTGAPLPGAVVTLQRGSGVAFSTVLSADPGIDPNVNPETTGGDGRYAWDVSPGDYRVVVAKSGFVTKTSQVVTIPPAVTNLDVALQPVGSGGSSGGSGGSANPVAQTASTPKKCKKKKGKKAATAKKCGKKK